jgi:hypothetical protein
MPCRCDPSPDEEEEALLLDLISYAFKATKTSIPKWVNDEDNSTSVKQRLDNLTNLLCNHCTNMSKKEQKTVIYDGRNPQARKLADWWEEHQEWDKARIKEEEKEIKKQKILKKLTKEERELLGL